MSPKCPHPSAVLHQSSKKRSSIVAPQTLVQVHPSGVVVSGSAISLTSLLGRVGSESSEPLPVKGQPIM